MSKCYFGGMPYPTAGDGVEYSSPTSRGRTKVQMNMDFAPTSQGATGVGAIAAAASMAAPSFAHPSHHHQSPPTSPNQQAQFTHWACDYCGAASFHSFEEARAHEEVCYYNSSRSAVVSPPQVASSTVNAVSTAAPMPALTLQQPAITTTTATAQYAISASSREETDEIPISQGTILRLYRDSDTESLSDRQCYVRRHFVEVFTATEYDVQARHSKGAQKLHLGQVGIRCVFCMHLHPKERAERAICYPSSVSRIYQTVADMQRFHFEACHCIPEELKQTYRTLKTTRPRGMGSPQQYWIRSAFEIGLVDSDKGIHLDATKGGADIAAPLENVSSARDGYSSRQATSHQHDSYLSPTGSTSPTHSSSSAESHASSPGMSAMLEAAELHARQQELQDEDTRDQVNSPAHPRSIPGMSHGDDDAIMLLSLRNSSPSTTQPASSPTYRPSGL